MHCHQHHVLVSSCRGLGRLTGRRVFVSDLGGGGWDVSAYVSTDPWFHGHLHLSEYSRRILRSRADARAQSSAAVLTCGSSRRFRGAIAGGVLFVGRLLPHKGIDDLIGGCPRACR